MDRINQVGTVPRAKALQHLRLPERLLRLKDEQQSGALVRSRQQVDELLRQAVLDEWDARCRNSAGATWLATCSGIIQKAIRGEFKAWAEGVARVAAFAVVAAATSSRTCTLCTSTACLNGPGREAARAYLAKLRSALGDS